MLSRPWRERIREGWALVWAWTVLSALGATLVGSALPTMYDSPLEIRLPVSVLVCAIFACCPAGQAWLLQLPEFGRVSWIFGWVLLPLMMITDLGHPLVALPIAHLVQTMALRTSRHGVLFWLLLVPFLFIACCGGVFASFLIREGLSARGALPPLAYRLMASDATLGFGWVSLFFFVQGMIIAFLTPGRDLKVAGCHVHSR